MREIVVVSGKGGTGKTMLMASFAHLYGSAVLADCDVDAPNLHLVVPPKVVESGRFTGLRLATIAADRCTCCGTCVKACRFGAVGYPGTSASRKPIVEERLCEGCGLCARLCRDDAIAMKERVSGEWFVSETAYGPMAHALLEPGAENSGKLSALVKQKAREVAARDRIDTVLVDGPPGIGCAAIAALSGADLAVVVTEPTLSGQSDLRRIVQLAKGMGVRTGVVVNKHDINPDIAAGIEREASASGVELLGRIPFDEEVVRAIARGVPPVTSAGSPAANAIHEVWRRLRDSTKGTM